MSIAIYPGSFDPVTNGHLDIIKRSSKMFDKLVIGVLSNNAKTPLFSVKERVNMLEEVTKSLSNVEIQMFEGLTVDFARNVGATVMVRGLRAISDFDYELQIAQTNHILLPGTDTVFLATSLEYAFLSSTTVKEVAYYGADISKFVPASVEEKIMSKFQDLKNKSTAKERVTDEQ